MSTQIWPLPSQSWTNFGHQLSESVRNRANFGLAQFRPIPCHLRSSLANVGQKWPKLYLIWSSSGHTLTKDFSTVRPPDVPNCQHITERWPTIPLTRRCAVTAVHTFAPDKGPRQEDGLQRATEGRGKEAGVKGQAGLFERPS